MKTSTIVVVLVALIVIVGGWYWYANKAQNPGAASPSTNTTVNTNPNGADTNPNGTPGSDTSGSTSVNADVNAGVSSGPKTVTVTLTSNGFSPSSVTINKGDTVTFVNQSGDGMWIASDPHPTHTSYDGTSRSTHCAAGYSGAKPFDECTNSNSFSFTFDKTGSFGYHNHIVDEEKGTVVVQ